MEFKNITENKDFIIFEAEYEDTIQVFRMHKQTEQVYVKLTNDFLKANGFANFDDWFKQLPEDAQVIKNFGGIPEWILVDDCGNYLLLNKNKLN